MTTSTGDDWLGVVDCLGYLVCRACNAAGRGKRLVAYVWPDTTPHAQEACDYCGWLLDVKPEAGCYGCLGTGRIQGFGCHGRTCPCVLARGE